MQELNPKLRVLKALLYQVADNISPENCNPNDEEVDEAIESLTKLHNGIPRISKVEACEKILHCSTRTFDNYLKLGIIPPGHKTPHFKELSWSKNDFKQAIKYRQLNKDDE